MEPAPRGPSRPRGQRTILPDRPHPPRGAGAPLWAGQAGGRSPSADAGARPASSPGVAAVVAARSSERVVPPVRMLTGRGCFDICRNMDLRQASADIAKLADMLAAMGTEPRLRIMRLLLSAHPGGLVVSEVQEQLGINGSTLSHHLERLRHEALITSRREGTFLRYSVNVDSLRTLLSFLYGECCGRDKAIAPDELFDRCQC